MAAWLSPDFRSIDFVPPAPEGAGDGAGVQVKLEDGSFSSFAAAMPDQPGRLLRDEGQDFAFGAPTLFIARMDQETVGDAVSAMASDMGGYWLRYFNSLGDLSRGERSLKLADGRRRKKGEAVKASALSVVSVALTEAYPPRSPEVGCAVVQARLSDGREFSILTATPSWFEKAFAEQGLRFYFGPSILFVRRLDPAVARKAVKAMAAEGDRWLCLYDTPRTTLPEVLARFKSLHP